MDEAETFKKLRRHPYDVLWKRLQETPLNEWDNVIEELNWTKEEFISEREAELQTPRATRRQREDAKNFAKKAGEQFDYTPLPSPVKSKYQLKREKRQ